ncbi:hypothetical protein SUGI_0606710 [Cryptomeria japonica]|uniref:glycosyltransferase family 92 protein RCOM_0530710 n=1 Tax=Cryptomeria japonica TaxID=3369 RepID=UPI002414BF0C|nr:glycosyltransferase family 92 protein RCOM_0530710 [Cryptomeria japonica]GLJ30638.1 hypothetical protein SUGI_0606710 [Cryptomeria japonica]
MVEDCCLDEKWGLKDRYSKLYHQKMDGSNDKIRVNGSSTKLCRSGDSLGRRVLVKRFLICMVVFTCFFFIARQFIDLFHPTTEKLLTQAHHPRLLRISNAVEERVEDKDDSLFVQDLALFPDHVLVFLSVCNKCYVLQKEDCECVYRETGRTYKAPVMSVDLKEQDLEIIRCPHPPQPKSAQGYNLTINLKKKGLLVPSNARYWNDNYRWKMLVYEALIEEDNAILFVKGLNLKSGKVSGTDNLLCVFSSDLDSNLLHDKDLKKLDASGLENKVIKTKVIMAAQEVIRCEKPEGIDIRGMKASVWEFRRGLFPSVALPIDKIIKNAKAMKTFRPLHKVCACTMIWNKASFLKEWITYHGYLGIQRWFLYDNNSDDNIEEVVDSLGSFNVSRIVWPWIKSQEAGFSHCALRAREECEWVAFMDIDEFINPIEYIQNGTMFTDSAETGPTVMQRLIDNATSVDTNALKIGEIRIDCHSFGPSGLTKHPVEGVIAGYTCRLNRTERHKSIIRPSALNLSLLNVVHHFHLKCGYRYRNLPRGFAVVNHYKYQVWDTFKAKFYRRVATYVTDWQENENESSKDRAPGLGTEPIEPSDWPERFCEVSDTFLRNFTIESFTDPVTHLQPWQQL